MTPRLSSTPAAPLHLDPQVFPPEPWKLVETQIDPASLGHRETLFALANGYLGIRGASSDGTHVHDAGTYINGFHETWPIHYPEDAVGMARTGQTMIAVPDATGLDVTIDGETFVLGTSAIENYQRSLDLRSGELRVEALWTTTGGSRIHCVWTRMVSMVDRHVAVLAVEVTSLDGAVRASLRSTVGPPFQSSTADGVVEPTTGDDHDPRQATQIAGGALRCLGSEHVADAMITSFETKRSGLQVSCAARHELEVSHERAELRDGETVSTQFEVMLTGQPVRLIKYVAYHDTVESGESGEWGDAPTRDRCRTTLDAAVAKGAAALAAEQQQHLDTFWRHADIEIDGNPADQQALRWNLFALAQATSCARGRGVSAKGVTSAGYDGHYFWDTEIYVVPFLTATRPALARPLLEFRHGLLDAARERASEMSEDGALFPWRTIMGAEASAFFLAGTAQYHINAAVGHAIERYTRATGDDDFLGCYGAEIMVEIARFWLSLGFYSDRSGDRDGDQQPAFHIHAVTGPDEYTALVNDNFYTNVMAQADLRFAAQVIELLRDYEPTHFEALVHGVQLADEEAPQWLAAADAMYLPYDDEQGIHLQNDDFLERQPWPWETTPADKYPLLLNFHPLVIYRHQVLKQPDVVMAMYLRSENFSSEQIERNFDFYEPLTTGDSSLSSCVQAIVAAKANRSADAALYLNDALYLDLCNTHGNTADGVHVASTGGVWAAIMHGYLGLEVHADRLIVQPAQLPTGWGGLRTQIMHRGDLIAVEADAHRCTFSVANAGRHDSAVLIECRGENHELTADSPVVVPSQGTSPTRVGG